MWLCIKFIIDQKFSKKFHMVDHKIFNKTETQLCLLSSVHTGQSDDAYMMADWLVSSLEDCDL